VALLEVADVAHQLLGQFHLRPASLDVRAVKPLDVILVEDRRHRLNFRELRLELHEQFFFEHARVQRGFVSVFGENVPRAEDDVVQVGERDEVFDERRAALGALAEADRPHLRQAADGLGQAFFDRLDSGDERGRNGSESDEQNAEFAFGCGDGRAFLDHGGSPG
jgi:hypothetical protein